MRVIFGKAKGTRLGSLKGADIRPTLDRVKESFFNQVGPGLNGLWFLDLFAGTGSMGLEALSRGAKKVFFVEIDPRGQKLIYSNLEKCRFWKEDDGSKEENWILLKSDAIHAIHTLAERGHRFDLVYVDPPFDKDLYASCLAELSASAILDGSSRVIVEHFHKNALNENYGKLHLISARRTGDTRLSFFSLQEK